jgi:NitT/TauT family transport system permease protein
MTGVRAAPSLSPEVAPPEPPATPWYRRRRVVVWGGRILLPLILGLVWEWLVNRGTLDPFFTSKPSAILKFFFDEVPTRATADNLWVTLKETLGGFALGASAGVLTGLLLARFQTAYDITRPFITAINSLPRVALYPLFVLWFGLGPTSKVIQAVSLVYFILLYATLGAIGNVDPDLVRLSRSVGFSQRRTFVKVMLPWAVPGIFAGLELGLVYAFLGAVVGEMLAAQAGIGQQLQLYANTFRTDAVFGTLLLLAIVATSLAMLMDLIKRRLMRYRD